MAGVELGTAYISLVIDSKQVPGQVKKALGDSGKSADAAGQSMGSKLASGLGKTFAVGAAAAVAAGTLAVGTALNKGWQRLSAIDNAEGKLEGLGHTSLGTAKIMESALASVKGTAFGLGEAATISASAVAAGIKPGNDLTRYLSITADAATIAGTSIEEMGAVMNKVQTKGKAYTLDLNQLAIRGLPIYQWLAKEMGVTQEALGDMVAEGKVDSATYLAAIEKNIGGAARAGNTVSAAWANTMAAMGRVGAAGMGPTFGRLADWMKGITTGIDVVTPKVKSFAEMLDHRIFNMGVPALKEFAEAGREAFGSFMSDNGGTIGNNWERLKTALSDIGDTAAKIGAPLLTIGASLAKAQAAIGVGTWSVFLNVLESVSTILNVTLVPALNGLSALMSGNQGAVTALFAAFLLFKTLPGIIGRIAPSMSALAAQTAAGTRPLSAYQRSLVAVNGAASTVRGGLRSVGSEIRSTQAFASAAGRPIGVLRASLLNMGTAATASGTVLGKMGSAYSSAAPGMRTFATQQSNVGKGFANAALGAGQLEQKMNLMGRGMYATTASGIATVGRAASGVGAAGFSAMSSAASGLSKGFGAVSGALGGPVGIGIIAAAIAVPALISSAKNWDIQAKNTKKYSDDVAVAQRKMARAFTESKGAVDDNVLSQMSAQSDAYLDKLKKDAASAPGVADMFTAYWKNVKDGEGVFSTTGKGGREYLDRANNAANAEQSLAELKRLEIGSDELTAALTGTKGQWQEVYGKMFGASDNPLGGMNTEIISGFVDLRNEFEATQKAAKNVTPGIYEIADGFKVLGDTASTTSQKASAFKSVMDTIAGIPPDLGNAMSTYNQVLREMKGLISEEWDLSKGGLGDALIDAKTGMVDTATENGEAVRGMIQGIKTEAINFVAAGGDVNEIVAKNADLFGQLAKSVGWTDDKLAGVLAKEGYLEQVLHAGAALQGLDDVTKGIGMVKMAMDELKPGEPKIIPMELLNDKSVRDQLEKLGVLIEPIDNGANFKLTMDDKASAGVDAFMVKAEAIRDMKASLKIGADTNEINVKSEQTKKLMDFMGTLEAKPGVRLNIDEFKDKKTWTVDELAELSQKFANPKAFLDGLPQFLIDAGAAKNALDLIQSKKVVIDVVTQVQNAGGEVAPWIAAIGENSRGSRLPRNSTGSRLPTTGPGTDTVDGILGVGRDGVPTTWVDKGEWIVNGKSSEKHDRLLAAINRDDPRLKNLPGFVAGGRNGIQNAIGAGRSVEGNKYVWGGTGPTGFDCSGFVGWLQQIVQGITGSVKRLYTTHAFLNGGTVAGLVPGLGPSGTQFQVGVSQDHMAATIAGQSAESGGAHGTSGIGGGRANAQSSQFPIKYHLPNSLIAGWIEGQSSASGGGRGQSTKKVVEWTDKNQLDLEKADLNVTKARETRDDVYGNAKKSANDRAIADKNVEIAEQKVVDLQKRKDDAAAGNVEEGPAPQAPSLEKAYTAQEKERVLAQIAYDDANDQRNEVYADIEASENDRLKADIALQDADEALKAAVSGRKDGKDYSLKGIARSYADGLLDAAFTGLEGQDYFGIGQSRWVSTDFVGLAGGPDAVEGGVAAIQAATFTQADIDAQTGGLDIAQIMLEQFGIKRPKVYDNGGWLQPGETAINLSSRPEPIFNSPAQLNKFMGGDLQPAQAPVYDMSIHIGGDMVTADTREMIRELRRQQEFAVIGRTGG